MCEVSNCVTTLAIGESGVGKSQFGCGFLQIDDAFETNSSPDSCTYKTSSQSNKINGITRHFIDTQGLASTDGLDAEYIQQMIEFLISWKLGVNAFFIIINIQNPKFDQGIQRLIQYINDFFNNPDFWNQTGIVFTRCYPNYFDKKVAETQYRQRVIDFIKTFPGCENINPQMPCFFVDSVNWRNDDSTKFEIIRAFEFAHKNQPVPTQKLKVFRPEYKDKKEEKLEKVLIKSELVGKGADKTRIYYYQDQIRYKITDWNNHITYTKPKMIREWTEKKKSIIKEDSKVEQNKSREERFRSEKYGSRRYLGIAGPRKERQVHDYFIDKTDYTQYKRTIITDPDGNVSYGEWQKEKQWSESKKS